MLFSNTFTYAIAFVAVLPLAFAGYPFDGKTKLADIGQVPMEKGQKYRATKWMGRCGGDDVPPGDFACGLYGENGTRGTAIYKCVKWEPTGEYWLKRAEVCIWSSPGGYGQCVRNQRRKGKKFYPLVDGKKAVCVPTSDFNS